MNIFSDFKNIFLNIDFILIFFYLFSIFAVLLVTEIFTNFYKKNQEKKNQKYRSELKRKVPHILIGFIFINSIFFLKKEEMIILAVLVFIFALINKFFLFFDSFLEIKRVSFGVIFFPLSVILLTLFFWDKKEAFVFGLLVLTLADSFAAIFGKIFAKKKILKNSKKTYLGTFAFFISTFIFYLLLKFPELKIKFNILDFDFLDIFQFSEKNFENNKNKTIFLDIAQGTENSFFDIFLIFGKAFFVSLILTIIEFFFIFGLDNLFLPIFGAFLFSIF